MHTSVHWLHFPFLPRQQQSPVCLAWSHWIRPGPAMLIAPIHWEWFLCSSETDDQEHGQKQYFHSTPIVQKNLLNVHYSLDKNIGNKVYFNHEQKHNKHVPVVCDVPGCGIGEAVSGIPPMAGRGEMSGLPQWRADHGPQERILPLQCLPVRFYYPHRDDFRAQPRPLTQVDLCDVPTRHCPQGYLFCATARRDWRYPEVGMVYVASTPGSV